MNNLKKSILFLIILLNIFFGFSIEQTSAYETIIQQDMRVGRTDGDGVLDIGGGEDVSIKDHFFRGAMFYVMGIVILVAIAVFIYIGFELATAEGAQDKFKKGLKTLVFAGVGLAVIPLAYIIIKIVTGFSF